MKPLFRSFRATMCRNPFLVAMFLTLAGVGSSIASDGVVEINQTCAVATGCFAGDGPGFPVTISEPSSYRLTSRLDVQDANSTAVEIQTTGVTLDLNGFSINGASTSGTGRGIHSALPNGTISRVVVRNGSVAGMGSTGIDLFQQDVRIESMHVTSNGGPGIILRSGVVRGNIVSDNAGIGILCDIWCTIQENEVQYNGDDGIFGSGLARGNNIVGNSGTGIRLNQGLVTGNIVLSNGGTGLVLSGVVGYGDNVISGHTPEVNGGLNLRSNVCGFDTSCP